jgi:hypothetical protein
MASGNVLVALQGAFFTFEGQPVTVIAGKTTVREGHPILRDRGNLFGPLAVDYDLPAAPADDPPAVTDDLPAVANDGPPAKAAAVRAKA